MISEKQYTYNNIDNKQKLCKTNLKLYKASENYPKQMYGKFVSTKRLF